MALEMAGAGWGVTVKAFATRTGGKRQGDADYSLAGLFFFFPILVLLHPFLYFLVPFSWVFFFLLLSSNGHQGASSPFSLCFFIILCKRLYPEGEFFFSFS